MLCLILHSGILGYGVNGGLHGWVGRVRGGTAWGRGGGGGGLYGEVPFHVVIIKFSRISASLLFLRRKYSKHYTVYTRIYFCFINNDVQCYKTVSTNHSCFCTKKREPTQGIEPRSPAYQPNALPLGQTGSPVITRVLFSSSSLPFVVEIKVPFC